MLASDETAPLSGRNLSLMPGDTADAVEVPLLDRLRARLGEEAVVRLAPHAEHRPELAMRDLAAGSAVDRATTAAARRAASPRIRAPNARRPRMPARHCMRPRPTRRAHRITRTPGFHPTRRAPSGC